MQIRRATRADIPDYVRLKGLLMTTGWPFPVELDEGWADRCSQTLEDLLDSRDHLFLVADDEGAVVAAITAVVERHLPGPQGTGRHGYIGDMCTDEAYRGRGIGRQMLQQAMDWLEDQGVGSTSLYATESGLPLYRAAGFSEPDGNNPFTFMRRRTPPREGQA